MAEFYLMVLKAISQGDTGISAIAKLRINTEQFHRYINTFLLEELIYIEYTGDKKDQLIFLTPKGEKLLEDNKLT